MTDVKATLERARASVRNAREILPSIAGAHWAMPALRRDLTAVETLLTTAIDWEKTRADEEPKK